MNLNRIQFEHGSVMLETILVLPVYFILIAMTFYVGEISLYRNLLLELDQFDLQYGGSRHTTSGRDKKIAQWMFRMEENVDRKWSGFKYEGQESADVSSEGTDWWKKTQIRNKGSMQISAWIKGIWSLPSLFSRQENNFQLNDSSAIYGSSEALALYSRKSSDEWRGGTGSDLCSSTLPKWVHIANESYCGNSAGGTVSGKTLAEYTRAGFDTAGNGASIYAVFSGE